MTLNSDHWYKNFPKFLSFALGAGLILLSQASIAQNDELDREPEAEFLEEVVVTGSRIKRRDFSSPSPLTTVDREAFEFSGQPTLEEYLNQMPQLAPDFGRTANNPGNGTARLNLRGLGAGRTLVLLNGRRLAPSGVGSAIDVNNLPRSMVDKVEIITGGASTVYGSDAIAGVINFITRQDFDGLSVDASNSISGEGDAQILDANIVYGHELASGKGNITVYAGYYDREYLFASEREISSKVLIDTWENYEVVEGGSSFIPAGRVTSPRVELGSGNGRDRVTWNPDGTPRIWDSSVDFYNYAPVNYLQTPLTRYSLGLQANFNISDKLEAYFEAGYVKNEAESVLAPSPFGGTIFVNTDNPVLTPETRQLFEEQLSIEPGLARMGFRRRMLELGQRIIDYDREYMRFVAGVRGDIAEGWEVDAWITYTDSSETELQLNDGSVSRLLQGLLVDPLTGQCFDPSGGCVPLDIFGEGRLSPEGVDFIRHDPFQNDTSRKQSLASVVLTGSPFDIWSGPLNMAFGAEWRQDKGNFTADEALFSGDTMGYRGDSPVSGTESVYELYTEALVPLIDNHNTGHYLGLELGVRYSDYKNAGPAWTYKAGLEWQPISSLRFRTMFQHSVRAPNNQELFQEQFIEDFSAISDDRFDPCSASQDPAGNGIADKCMLQGLGSGQIGVFEAEPFYPVDFIFGGNPNLVPEDSDTLTVGVVITPEAVPGLIMALDYFDLEVTNTIGDISAFEICFDPLNAGNAFCENISRDATGNISQISEPISNRGLLAVKGFDAQLQYQMDLPSSLSFLDEYANLNITSMLTHYSSVKSQENVVTEIRECNGLFGWPCWDIDGVSFPENRLITSLDYSSGALNIHLTWRWIDSMENAAPLSSALYGYPDPELGIQGVGSYNFFDLGFGYRFNDQWRARLGVTNLFDQEPPLMADQGNSGNTDPSLYDIFGRSFYLSFVWERKN
jgi:iron complex outermembrane receptor protein